MRRLLALLGIVSAISGYQVNIGKVQEVFSSTEYSFAQKEAAANEAANAFEDIYQRILNDDEMF
jgi:conjugal transfer/entry exclusion protein